MTEQEFRKNLANFDKVKNNDGSVIDDETKKHLALDTLYQYLSSIDTVPYSIISFFEATYCPISSSYHLLEINWSRLITEYYAKKINEVQNFINDCLNEDSTLFIGSKNGNAYSFIPFGKLDSPSNHEYFLKSILNKDTLSDDEKYQLFKAYIYTHFVETHSTYYDGKHYYLSNETIDFIDEHSHEFADRFKAEQHEYLEKSGLFGAQKKLSELKRKLQEDLAEITPEENSKVVEIWIDADYDKKNPTHRVKVIYN